MLSNGKTTNEWEHIEELVRWLNRHNAVDAHEVAMRLMKIGEEFGEVIEAYNGIHKQNPRKDASYIHLDVMDELCDVIATAMVALATLSSSTDIAQQTFRTRLETLTSRSASLDGQR